MFKTLVSLFALGLAGQANAADFWWAYMASYENQAPGSTRVNLGLKERAPVAGYPQVVITGVTYGNKGVQGLPQPGDLDRLNALAVKVEGTIAGLSPSIYTGTFTHQYQQLHYVYVKKTEGVDAALRKLYARECPGCKTSSTSGTIPSGPATSHSCIRTSRLLTPTGTNCGALDFQARARLRSRIRSLP